MSCQSVPAKIFLCHQLPPYRYSLPSSATHDIAIYPLTFNHTAKKISKGNNNKNVISAPIQPPRMCTAINQSRLILYCSLTRISARQIDTNHDVLRASLMNEILVGRGVDARSLPNQEVPKSGRNSEGIYRDGERRSRKKEEIKGGASRNKHTDRVSSCIMDRAFFILSAWKSTAGIPYPVSLAPRVR